MTGIRDIDTGLAAALRRLRLGIALTAGDLLALIADVAGRVLVATPDAAVAAFVNYMENCGGRARRAAQPDLPAAT